MQGLVVRKLADKSEGERIVVPILETVQLRNGEEVQVATGQTKLVNPDTPGTDHEPWPLAGIHLEQAPDETQVSVSYVDQAVEEGWMERVGERLVRRPAGPPDRPTRSYHTLVQCDALVIHTDEGDVKYWVTHQPDKYADDREFDERGRPATENSYDDDTIVDKTIYNSGNTRVDHFYGLQKDKEPQS